MSDELERLRAELERVKRNLAEKSETANKLATHHFKAMTDNARLREALTVSLAAMQKNIAYATRKDEHALMVGIDAARAALASTDPSPWLTEFGMKVAKETREQIRTAVNLNTEWEDEGDAFMLTLAKVDCAAIVDGVMKL